MNRNKFGIVLPIILLSYFMILLDNSLIFTSTVKISNELSLSPQILSWVTNAYALTFGGFLLLAGKAGDVYGRKVIFLLGLIIFSVGSLMVGLSINGLMIILMRAVQGLGSAILAPTTLALLMDNYHDETRTKAIEYYGATGGLGASLGLVIGGLIASYFSWRYGFIINVPIGIIMSILTIKYVKEDTKIKESLDWLGSLWSILGLSSLIYSITVNKNRFIFLALSILFIIIFILQEKRSNNPIMPLEIFKSNERSSAYIARFFFLGAMIAYFFLTPQAMQKVYGYTPLLAAIGFLPETIPQFLSATLLTRLNHKYSNKQFLLFGVITTFIGLLTGTLIGVENGYWLSIGIPMVIIGIGQGFSLSPLTVSGVANTNAKISGAASGVVNTVHQVGSSFGLSVVIALTGHYVSPVESFNHSLIVITGLMLIAVIAVFNISFQKN
ncbi:major facilitator superfamily permease [Apilactobacillus ozensis DSM 23829 = JCM 17196]|uniref:Major facilitator superfamily permease n=1 Tax=Apilactobacillus ozensis DSM 23829 = JCM 17196 TaxID=1423781 RepID=A0A0R2AXG3_9LACO|nr:MFS transporter [Apilactobacillus ozensis]KRM67564.1 major facilitator superfamily permease [Apilactobacillus ozensis DSM 23829 = JCM 17196]